MSMTRAPLWTSFDAAAATGGKTDGRWVATGVSIDTRTLEPGDLFVALTGESRDGHEFVADALKKGAAAVLVSRQPPGVAADAPLLMVSDTQMGLEGLGRAARERSKARIVAVTGSAGKTTTKEMLRLILARSGSVHASAASYNNHWGVPLSLARMPLDTAYGVFEIGMNHAGEIRSLVKFVRPHVAVITTIAPAHLEHFGRVEAIADAKSEIFEGIEPGGAAILPLENPQFDRLLWHAKENKVSNILTFGKAPAADARLLSSNTEVDGQRVLATIGKMRLAFAVNAAGGHIAMNAIAALLAARELGADVARGADELANFAALKGRGAPSLPVASKSSTNPTTRIRHPWRPLSSCSPRHRHSAAGGASRRSATCASFVPIRPPCTRRSRAILRRRAPIWCSCAAPTCARCGMCCPRRPAVTMRRRHRRSRPR